ncbi:hypothetical protein PMAYCL1PPCAC_32185, partial [Pristionchus mayeri]
VAIALNITEPVSEIEVHSLGLTIETVELSVWEGLAITLNGGEFIIREERETFAIPSSRPILPGENLTLTITYSGTVRMDGRGLYESWNTLEESVNPYISLNTDCEPTSARRWFPCFDEPDKKATFQLTVTHPNETNAYSNAREIFLAMDSSTTRITH